MHKRLATELERSPNRNRASRRHGGHVLDHGHGARGPTHADVENCKELLSDAHNAPQARQLTLSSEAAAT